MLSAAMLSAAMSSAEMLSVEMSSAAMLSAAKFSVAMLSAAKSKNRPVFFASWDECCQFRPKLHDEVKVSPDSLASIRT